MEDRIVVKREDNEFYGFTAMSLDQPSLDPPPVYQQMTRPGDHITQQQTPPSTSSSSLSMNMDLFGDIGGTPFQMKLKTVNQYLEDGPALPVKNAKPPARPIPQQTFSSLPSSVKQDPRDPTKVVGERSTTSYVSELYEYIQGNCPKHSVKEFVFQEPFQQQFTVVLKLNGLLEDIAPPYDRKGDDMEETPKLFPSKKAAKEFVAHLALEKLKELPVQPEHIVVGPGKLKSESPMGELNRFCSQNALPRPHVIDTSNSKPPYYFGCEITIDINGEHKFGDPHPNQPNKTSARNAAAQQALNWIARENPKIIKMKGKSGKSGRVLAPGSLVEIDATGKTIGEIATEACALLGFKAPQKELIPIEDMQGVYNVYVNLEHSEQITRVGPLKNVFGQKAASREAMKATLQTVQHLAQKAYGVKVVVTGTFDFDLGD
ncbi:hypothetical protein H072_2820 [Dactylellina haptotyla CBS 200.50]|uniref:DRBM domain-containing protein n=1 Tax=Dactylellina haptotyla (strain CBS 200.50) TaxID=1284197 RepID=S8AJP9_DACHA|nr:hypothetical protein H072_2820 [Dactylellina haptotyla CBS 200.50]